MLVETIAGKIEDFEVDGKKVDRLLLNHYDLTKPHQRAVTEGGRRVAISLGRGERLYKGAVLYMDDALLVVVDLACEEVLDIRPSGKMMWARVAFNIGNMHHPAYLTEESILCPYDPIIERLVKNMGVEYERTVKAMNGMKANFNVSVDAAGHGHGYSPDRNHSHDHGHSAGHDHGHSAGHGHSHSAGHDRSQSYSAGHGHSHSHSADHVHSNDHGGSHSNQSHSHSHIHSHSADHAHSNDHGGSHSNQSHSTGRPHGTKVVKEEGNR